MTGEKSGSFISNPGSKRQRTSLDLETATHSVTKDKAKYIY